MAETSKRAAFYLRHSARGPTIGAQIIELAHLATRAGWQRGAIYRDGGIRGAKSSREHPELDRLLKDAARRQFDVVMAWSVDQLAHSLQNLVPPLGALQKAGIDLYLQEQGDDTLAASS